MGHMEATMEEVVLEEAMLLMADMEVMEPVAVAGMEVMEVTVVTEGLNSMAAMAGREVEEVMPTLHVLGFVACRVCSDMQ